MKKDIVWFLIIVNTCLMLYWGINGYLESKRPKYYPYYYQLNEDKDTDKDTFPYKINNGTIILREIKNGKWK